MPSAVVRHWVSTGNFEPLREDFSRAPEDVSAGVWLSFVLHLEAYNGLNGAEWVIEFYDFARRNRAALFGHTLLIEMVEGVLNALRLALNRQLDFVAAFRWIIGGDIIVAVAGASILGAAIPVGLCALVGFVTTRSSSRMLMHGIDHAEKVLKMLEHTP